MEGINNKNIFKRGILYPILFTVLFIISLTSLVLVLINTDCELMKFTRQDVTELLGIMVSSFALVITTIFVILAISAYGRIREIEDITKKANELRDSIEDTNKQFKIITERAEELLDESKSTLSDTKDANNASLKALTEFYDFFQILHEEQIANSEKLKNTNLRVILKKNRARMAYRLSSIDVKERVNLLRDLSALGDDDDLQPLEMLKNNENEPEELRQVASYVLDTLKNRLNIQ